MKIIDLLNKIANGEINEDIEIEYQNGYNFEYCNIRNFFDKYIVDKENLNQEIQLVKSLEEENKIPEKLDENRYIGTDLSVETDMFNKINEIIDYLKSKGE
ncbi:MAG: hypothetical protein J6T23_02565 [Elusimicrobia bacterium]|nr:hypothetical protein [Elusimicrobiota bacterium]